uniref:Alpha-amylase I n=1 Tax=Lygus hesperus TaxID=30085 RepID=A0A0A9YII5_LYGHE
MILIWLLFSYFAHSTATVKSGVRGKRGIPELPELPEMPEFPEIGNKSAVIITSFQAVAERLKKIENYTKKAESRVGSMKGYTEKLKHGQSDYYSAVKTSCRF